MRVEFTLPDLGENIDSGEIVKLLVKVGDVLEPEKPVMELETGKAVVEVPSDVKGRVAAILVEEGDKITVGQAVLSVETDLNVDITAAKPAPPPELVVPVKPAPVAEKTEQPAQEPSSIVAFPAAPAAKRVARELGVDLVHIAGSGPGGLITEEDVRTFAGAKPRAEATVTIYEPLPDFSRFGKSERKPMSSVRLATAQHLAHAWNTVPQVTQYDDADVTQLDIVRKPYAEKVAAMGGKLTVTSVLLKVVASALKQFPQFNTSVDMAAREIIQKQYIHVGVAVNTERGLLVPVIRDANQKNILELAVELSALTKKAHARELKPADLEGGTFSITNLGTVGGTHFTPIVNWPEVAILGISRSRKQAVWVEDHFEPRLFLPLSLSYDHRVIDGADGAKFLRWICEALEQPFFLALEG
ncbi:2-oxo acid dehydrogenase subunit E2 [candidate division KSB1 bacterium]|nr:MAG: 2-oxo acid dehydrogenase subunit E2 [candidate division KSB1 bacterium]